MNKEIREIVLGMNLMSDIFFNAFMYNNNDCMEDILRTVIGRKDIYIRRMETQHTVPNPFSRGVRYDVFATDEKGDEYDFEVQQGDEGAVPERGRYNSAMMDYRALDKGQDWKKLPTTYVIFITDKDIWGGNKPLYRVNRRIEDMDGMLFNDRANIIYINGAYRAKEGEEKTPLMKLIEDFHCVNADNMNSPVLAKRMKQIKILEEEMSSMCKEVEKYAEKYAEKKLEEYAEKYAEKKLEEYAEKKVAEEKKKTAEAKKKATEAKKKATEAKKKATEANKKVAEEKKKAAEEKNNFIIEMIKDKLPLEKIAQYSKMTIDQIKAIGRQG